MTNPPDSNTTPASSGRPRGLVQRSLDIIEWLGNKLPDPVLIFFAAMVLTWLLSAWLSRVEFTELDPRSGQPIRVINQLTGPSIVTFLTGMVRTFVEFPPLGVVLVALLGVGLAEQTGFVAAVLKGLLQLTPRKLLTPMLIIVAIVSHLAGDSGYVLIVPLGAAMFAAAGRHPLLGIAAAFAGVSGGFSACFVPTGLDPLLQSFTQSAARMIDPEIVVNPLCNWAFMSASCLVIVGVGWYITDRVVEPRLAQVPIDGDDASAPRLGQMDPQERRGMIAGLASVAVALALLAWWAAPPNSPWRDGQGELLGRESPLMKAIVPLILLLFLIPGIVHGVVAGTVKSHRDVVQGMTRSMNAITYYIVIVFFASLFTAAFTQSNVGVLLAIKGANALISWQLPSPATLVLMILLTSLVNLLIGSASAKWALLSPVLVPMLMKVGLSPELIQAAYRVGDSSTNIITPLNPYFPLVVVFCQRYVRTTGVGTLAAMMVPYSIAFLLTWTLLLLGFWWLELPLGLQAGYRYPP